MGLWEGWGGGGGSQALSMFFFSGEFAVHFLFWIYDWIFFFWLISVCMQFFIYFFFYIFLVHAFLLVVATGSPPMDNNPSDVYHPWFYLEDANKPDRNKFKVLSHSFHFCVYGWFIRLAKLFWQVLMVNIILSKLVTDQLGLFSLYNRRSSLLSRCADQLRRNDMNRREIEMMLFQSI